RYPAQTQTEPSRRLLCHGSRTSCKQPRPVHCARIPCRGAPCWSAPGSSCGAQRSGSSLPCSKRAYRSTRPAFPAARKAAALPADTRILRNDACTWIERTSALLYYTSPHALRFHLRSFPAALTCQIGRRRLPLCTTPFSFSILEPTKTPRSKLATSSKDGSKPFASIRNCSTNLNVNPGRKLRRLRRQRKNPNRKSLPRVPRARQGPPRVRSLRRNPSLPNRRLTMVLVLQAPTSSSSSGFTSPFTRSSPTSAGSIAFPRRYRLRTLSSKPCGPATPSSATSTSGLIRLSNSHQKWSCVPERQIGLFDSPAKTPDFSVVGPWDDASVPSSQKSTGIAPF